MEIGFPPGRHTGSSSTDPSPGSIQLSMTEILESAKEGLLALVVQTGLQVFQAMLWEEVTHLASPKGKHNPHRQAVRRPVPFVGRKVSVEKPRIRSVEGKELLPGNVSGFSRPLSADPSCTGTDDSWIVHPEL